MMKRSSFRIKGNSTAATQGVGTIGSQTSPLPLTLAQPSITTPFEHGAPPSTRVRNLISYHTYSDRELLVCDDGSNHIHTDDMSLGSFSFSSDDSMIASTDILHHQTSFTEDVSHLAIPNFRTHGAACRLETRTELTSPPPCIQVPTHGVDCVYYTSPQNKPSPRGAVAFIKRLDSLAFGYDDEPVIKKVSLKPRPETPRRLSSLAAEVPNQAGFLTKRTKSLDDDGLLEITEHSTSAFCVPPKAAVLSSGLSHAESMGPSQASSFAQEDRKVAASSSTLPPAASSSPRKRSAPIRLGNNYDKSISGQRRTNDNNNNNWNVAQDASPARKVRKTSKRTPGRVQRGDHDCRRRPAASLKAPPLSPPPPSAPVVVIPGRPGVLIMPRQRDVVFGRGTGPNCHPGSIEFRRLCADRKTDYSSGTSNKAEKRNIARKVVQELKGQDRRFILDGVEVADDLAVQKTMARLREK